VRTGSPSGVSSWRILHNFLASPPGTHLWRIPWAYQQEVLSVFYFCTAGGRLALSALLNPSRYVLKGMGAITSWDIGLDALRDRTGSLILLRNPFNGVVLSNLNTLLPLIEFRQVFVHFSFRLAAWCCFSADGLISKSRRKYGGSENLSETSPFPAFLASSSAASFPSTPSCSAVHLNVSLKSSPTLSFLEPVCGE